MQAEVQFDKQLLRFLSMAIEIWPSFQSGLRHLHDLAPPAEGSYLPPRDYRNMSSQQFTRVVTGDLFEFIMTHDVRESDLYDYLSDILDLLMMDEELSGGSSNPASIEFMTGYAHQVILELQNGKNERVEAFERDVYLNVKQFRGEIVQDKNNGHSSEEEEGEDDDEEGSDDGSYDSKEQERKKKAQKTEEQLAKQKQLQDDGWTIVKKK